MVFNYLGLLEIDKKMKFTVLTNSIEILELSSNCLALETNYLQQLLLIIWLSFVILETQNITQRFTDTPI